MTCSGCHHVGPLLSSLQSVKALMSALCEPFKLHPVGTQVND